ncbi:MAG: hypothetical protein ACPGVY_13625 [Mycobacterium sp.]
MADPTSIPTNNAQPWRRTLALIALRVAAVLWFVWGVFHVIVGITVIQLLAGEHPEGALSSVPAVVDVEFFGTDSTFAIIASLQQNGFNLAWFGLIVTIASVFVWRVCKLAVVTSIVVGGLADLGYFLYVDLPGYAEPPGPQMTYIMVAAIGLSVYAYFTSDRFAIIQALKAK